VSFRIATVIDGPFVLGAVILQGSTEIPLPIPPRYFPTKVDAERFVHWAGELPVTDYERLIKLARIWQRERSFACCPDCERGRVAPGRTICEGCEAQLDADRRVTDHERSKDHEGVDAG
jgi:hypothetical protein